MEVEIAYCIVLGLRDKRGPAGEGIWSVGHSSWGALPYVLYAEQKGKGETLQSPSPGGLICSHTWSLCPLLCTAFSGETCALLMSQVRKLNFEWLSPLASRSLRKRLCRLCWACIPSVVQSLLSELRCCLNHWCGQPRTSAPQVSIRWDGTRALSFS